MPEMTARHCCAMFALFIEDEDQAERTMQSANARQLEDMARARVLRAIEGRGLRPLLDELHRRIYGDRS